MKTNRIKNNISIVFLVIFLSMKLTGLHAFTHTDDKDHVSNCDICDYTITHNTTPTLIPNLQEFSIKIFEVIIQKETLKNYSFIVSKTIALKQQLSRPPPFSL